MYVQQEVTMEPHLPFNFCCGSCGKPFSEVAEVKDGKILVAEHEEKCKEHKAWDQGPGEPDF